MMFVENYAWWNGARSFQIASSWMQAGGGTSDSDWRGKDWWLALGSYRHALTAQVTVSPNYRRFTMKVNYFIDDWYEWNTGLTFEIPEMPGVRWEDSILGRLHRVGLAQEYHIRGSHQFTWSWAKGDTILINRRGGTAELVLWNPDSDPPDKGNH